MQAAFYLTPILYAMSIITRVSFQKVLLLNPMAQAIQDARFAAISHDSRVITISRVFRGDWHVFIPIAIVIFVFVGGVAYFKSQADGFAENL